MTQSRRPLLVVDTNVAIKAYLEEDFSEEAQEVLDAGNDGRAEHLLAPSLIWPEFWHTLAKHHRRGELLLEEAQDIWEYFSDEYPIWGFEIEPLIDRAIEISQRCGCTVYDALLVSLVDDRRERGATSTLVTADSRLLRALDGTPYANHARHLSRINELVERRGPGP